MCCFQLSEMRVQLDIRDNQICELKRLYKDSRDTETRYAQLVQQLRAELLTNHRRRSLQAANMGGGSIGDNSTCDMPGMMQQQHDHIAQLESQLRSVYQYTTTTTTTTATTTTTTTFDCCLFGQFFLEITPDYR